MGRFSIIPWIALVTFVACEQPGPLPATPLKTAVELQADWFHSDSLKPLPLDEAILNNQFDRAKELLEKGSVPNARWGQTGDHFPLQAVLNNNGTRVTEPGDTVRLLLKFGANPNARWCPFKSRGTGDIELRGRRPACTSARGSTALMFAAAAGRADIVEALIDAGADATATDWLGGSALVYATNEIAFEHISRTLFPHIQTRNENALAYLQRGDGRGPIVSPLRRAIEESDFYYLVPPPPPAIGEHEYEAHMQYWNDARETRIMERVRVALSIGADPDQSTLSWALDRKRHRVARVLLIAGANVNARQCGPDSYLTSPICTPENGVTLLTWMASRGDQQAVELLLAFGANPILKDWAGRIAADLAFTDEIRRLVTPNDLR
jgi:ankyrin repeat protein